jgi:hypothetical protein
LSNLILLHFGLLKIYAFIVAARSSQSRRKTATIYYKFLHLVIAFITGRREMYLIVVGRNSGGRRYLNKIHVLRHVEHNFSSDISHVFQCDLICERKKFLLFLKYDYDDIENDKFESGIFDGVS